MPFLPEHCAHGKHKSLVSQNYVFSDSLISFVSKQPRAMYVTPSYKSPVFYDNQNSCYVATTHKCCWGSDHYAPFSTKTCDIHV